LEKTASRNKSKIRITGFLNEKEIPLYYKACDLVLFPYRVFMSSSGPLSLVFSAGKPFLISRDLEGIFDNEDIKDILVKKGLGKRDFIFSMKDSMLEDRIIKGFKDQTLVEMADFSKTMGKARDFYLIGKKYTENLWDF